MLPLLKWAGGKRWLVPNLVNAVGLNGDSPICEPFVGSGALFFHLESKQAWLGDRNSELILAYQALAADPHAIADSLEGLSVDRLTFSQMRAWNPVQKADVAARLIYLNRTAFNGLWRVNLRGEFNVPFGCKPGTQLPTRERIVEAGRVLARTVLIDGDFEQTADMAPSDAVVYFDPPYTTTHNSNGFIRYNEEIFSWTDQVRLAALANSLASAERAVIVSNAAHSDVLHLYDPELFHAVRVTRSVRMAAQASHRREMAEVVLLPHFMIDVEAFESQMARPVRGGPRERG